MMSLKNTKKSAWLPLVEEKGYKKSFLVRKQQEKEAQEEIEDFVLEEEEFPVNDQLGDQQ